MTILFEITYAWVVGMGFLAAIAGAITGSGYLIREFFPVNTPLLKSPSYEFDEMDIGTSIVVGMLFMLLLIIPLLAGSAIVF